VTGDGNCTRGTGPDVGADPPDDVLQHSAHRRIVRVGDTVHRPVHPWSSSVHDLLNHLECVGFEAAPRYLGQDASGREVLSYLPGVSGADGWSRVVPEAGLVAMARLLRRYHDRVASFRPVASAGWAMHPGPVGPGELVCHGDFGPWNLVWKGTEPVGVLDWDYAWPQPPAHDLCYALEYVAPFRDDAHCLEWLGYTEPPDRRRRIELFAAGYGWPRSPGLVEELVDGVIAQQRQVAARTAGLAAAGFQPQATWAAQGHLAELDERIRWSVAHRSLS
jgi:hypothetical protein